MHSRDGESVIVNLIRLPGADGREGCEAEATGVPSHRLYGNPFSEAEAEVKRRVLRSLADRANPPANIAFVRTWEAPLPPEGDPEPAVLAGDAPRKRQSRGSRPK